MKKVKKVSFLFFIGIFSLVINLKAGIGADWVTDWVNSATYTGSGPSAYEFSTRDYYSMGYGSLRWQSGTINPITFSPPSIRFGCGGVDIFLGSLGLMDFGYLVDRMKTIMYSAGAFAFEYALGEMCDLCRNVLGRLDSVSNFLNQLQLDECKAGKVVATVAMKPFSDTANKEYSNLFAEKSLKDAIADTWEDFKKSLSGGTDRLMTSTEVSDINSQCSSFFNELIDPSIGNYSVLEYISYTSGIRQEWIPFVRGLVGDVVLDPESNLIWFTIAPCPQKSDSLLKSFIQGKSQKQELNISGSTIDRVCSDVTEGNNIVNIVYNNISNLYQAMENKTSPPSSTDDMIKIVGFDVYRELRLAYETGLTNTFITQNSPIVTCSSYIFTVSLLKNVLKEVVRLKYNVDKKYRKECGDTPKKYACAFCSEGSYDSFKVSLDIFTKKILEVLNTIEKESEQYIYSPSSPCQIWKRNQKIMVELTEIIRRERL